VIVSLARTLKAKQLLVVVDNLIVGERQIR